MKRGLALLLLMLLCGCVYVASNGSYYRRDSYHQDGTNTVNRVNRFDLGFDP